MKAFIYHILKHNKASHAQYKFDTYLYWCELYATNKTEVQTFLVNKKLKAWFDRQFDLLEDEFIEKVANAQTLDKTNLELATIYANTLMQIGKLHPMPIIRLIRKKRIRTTNPVKQ